MSERTEFLRYVRNAARGTPYAVTETERGFDLTLDVVDAKWYGLFFKQGLQRVYTHHVKVPDDGTYAVTDDSRAVEWQAGVPKLSASVERTRGRVYERSVEKVWAVGEDLRPATVVDYTFDSEEGRQLLKAAADKLGLKEGRGTEEKVGLVFAIVGGAGAVITLLVLAVMALLGKL